MHHLIYVLSCLLASLALPLHAQTVLGVENLSQADGSTLTLFYPVPQGSEGKTAGLGTLLARNAQPATLNRRLVVVSHGSGGSAWVHTHLAAVLVERGYVVAFPAHKGDHFQDSGEPGPESWKRRPKEISAAIDQLAQHSVWSQRLNVDRVGVYGQSAGGHTALSLAGGKWSTRAFLSHCQAHLEEDFNACVGAITRLTGSIWDGLKKTLARQVLSLRFHQDTKEYEHHDPRIAAVVAGNPYAADFLPESLARPRIPLGIVSTGNDQWLKPNFHSARVLSVCKTCEHLIHWPLAGHGALLSPYPHGESETVHALLADGAGFDRAQLAAGDKAIADFLDRHLQPKD